MWSSRNANSKVDSPSQATPNREAVTSEKIISKHFSTPI